MIDNDSKYDIIRPFSHRIRHFNGLASAVIQNWDKMWIASFDKPIYKILSANLRIYPSHHLPIDAIKSHDQGFIWYGLFSLTFDSRGKIIDYTQIKTILNRNKIYCQNPVSIATDDYNNQSLFNFVTTFNANHWPTIAKYQMYKILKNN